MKYFKHLTPLLRYRLSPKCKVLNSCWKVSTKAAIRLLFVVCIIRAIRSRLKHTWYFEFTKNNTRTIYFWGNLTCKNVYINTKHVKFAFGFYSAAEHYNIIDFSLTKEETMPYGDHFRHGLSQWETTLHCNVVSHWLSPHPAISWYHIPRKMHTNTACCVISCGLVSILTKPYMVFNSNQLIAKLYRTHSKHITTKHFM